MGAAHGDLLASARDLGSIKASWKGGLGDSERRSCPHVLQGPGSGGSHKNTESAEPAQGAHGDPGPTSDVLLSLAPEGPALEPLLQTGGPSMHPQTSWNPIVRQSSALGDRS